MLDALEPRSAPRSSAPWRRCAGAGAQIVELALPELGEVAAINATGGFSPAESWAWHRARLASREARLRPARRAAHPPRRAMSAADYIDLLRARAATGSCAWSARSPASMRCSARPCPASRRRLRRCVADDAPSSRPMRCCCATPPSSTCSTAARSRCLVSAGELPVGLMVWSAAMRDDAVLDAALAIEAAFAGHAPGALSMRIAVIGAGIIGVTTAYELARRGPRGDGVRAPRGVAAETSFANAGLVAPGYVTPWAAPGMPGRCCASCRADTQRCGCIRDSTWPGAGAGCAPAGRAPIRPTVCGMQRLAIFSRERLSDLRAAATRLRASPGLPGAAAGPQGPPWSSRVSRR